MEIAKKEDTAPQKTTAPKRSRGRPRKIKVLEGSLAAKVAALDPKVFEKGEEYLNKIFNFITSHEGYKENADSLIKELYLATDGFNNLPSNEPAKKEVSVKSEPVLLPEDMPGFFIEMLEVEASAGPGTYNEGYAASQQVFISNSEYYRNLYTENPANLRVLKIRGDSMEPLLHDGQTCIVRLENSFTSSGIYVFTYGDVTFIKRLQKSRDSYIAISENIKYPPFIIEESNNFTIHGKLVLGLDYTRL
ncbi:hypothetical protein CKF54_04970 [Psittacicella hinzii]|uniref:Peptidase S24/S26A/S26B/S26C domain-containing protein n=1 Tax=Psittacicella hinzii TaxID=2028575 RepID=A0A3A1Y217_9GAMM|nr:S24 family peptidase [Psittacicella hinzii]RIY32372.1 hypothetical protein CKF54_04970 [Psittacicella hinzii]